MTIEHLRQLHQQAQPSVGIRMDDGFGNDDGPHYTNEALVAKQELMHQAIAALPHLLDIAEALEQAIADIQTLASSLREAMTENLMSIQAEANVLSYREALARLENIEAPLAPPEDPGKRTTLG